jgi:hypothetical protein
VPLLLVAGLVGGLAGVGLLLAAPTMPPPYDYLLLGPCITSLVFALTVGVVTSPRLRQHARAR